MNLGLDFDNTLIDYDSIFYKTALKLGLIDKNIKSQKSVRNYLVNINQEHNFTFLQGQVYGKEIINAEKSEGMFDSLKKLKNKVHLHIVSHKTKKPIIGENYNLHKAAEDWLEKNGFDKDGLNINKSDVYFEEKKEYKIKRIHSLKLTYFIDDLESILDLIDDSIIKINFNKDKSNELNSRYKSFSHWDKLGQMNIFKMLINRIF